MLLDLVYLQASPTYALQVELQTLIGRVRQQAGVFQVGLSNIGNTPRSIALQAHPQEEGNSCTYLWKQLIARIVPQETVVVELQVLPRKRRQRPWFGGRVFNFSVGLEDPQQHPIPLVRGVGLAFCLQPSPSNLLKLNQRESQRRKVTKLAKILKSG
jgi:hypothetical protein